MRSTSDCILRAFLPFESRFFRKKKRPRVTVTARNTRAPMTVPAIAAMDVFLSGADVPGVGISVPDAVPDSAAAVVVIAEVDEGAGLLGVEEGDWVLRQAVLSVMPTVLMSEVPPLRPWESNKVNMIDVPAATFAFQVKDVGPTGGLRIKDVPPGMVPYK